MLQRGAVMSQVSVARQFTVTPGGRYRRISEFSGEEFRETMLLPAASRGELVEVDLDGVLGYGSSFLEEAFGGLVRTLHFTDRREFDRVVRVQTRRSDWEAEVNQYIDDALRKERASRQSQLSA